MRGKVFKRLWITAVIFGLCYVFFAVAVLASRAPLPQGLLWIMETYVSHDGQISDPQAVLHKIMVAPVLVLMVFMIGLLTFRAFPFPGYLLAVYVIFTVLYYSFYRWYVTAILENGQFEDSLLEWGGFVCAFGAAILFVISGRRGIRAAYFLALAFFVFAMEEISWGQRVLGISGPELITRHNLQSETNFHNFVSRDYFIPIYITMNMLGFFALTWFRRLGLLSGLPSFGNLGRVFSVTDRWGIWVIFLFLSLASVFPGEEFVEEQWSLLGLFLAALLLWTPNIGNTGSLKA